MLYRLLLFSSLLTSLLFIGCEKMDVFSRNSAYDTTFIHSNWYHIPHFGVDRKATYVNSIASDRNNGIWISVTWNDDAIYGYRTECSNHGEDCEEVPIRSYAHQDYIVGLLGTEPKRVLGSGQISFLYQRVSSIGFDNSGCLYVGANAGLYKIQDFHKQLWTKNIGYQKYLPIWDDNQNFRFTDFTFDNDNNVWFGDSYTTGLFRFNGSSINRYHSGNSIIPYSEVYDVAIDKSNNLWFNTYYELLKIENDEFEKVCCNLRSDAMAIDKKDNVWIVNGSELRKIKGDSVISFGIPDINNKRQIITDIAIDSKNNIWISTKPYSESRQGLIKFDGETWLNYNLENSPIHSNDLTKLHVDRFDNLWIGSRDNGIMIFNEEGIRY